MKKKHQKSPGGILRTVLLALVLASAAGTAAAQAPGRGSAGPTVRATTPLIQAGDTVEVGGTGFKAGQKVTLSAAGDTLNALPFVADAEGRFSGRITVPGDASLGAWPVAIQAEGAADSSFDLKISRRLPLSGQERFSIAGNKLVQGLYQSAYSARSNAVYVTSAIGRPPVKQSELLKVDPATLQIVARAVPAPAPAREPQPGQKPRESGLYAVYGVAVDDARGTVWVTNSRQNTVAVYNQSDLSLVKQFPADAVPHARDVVIDAGQGKAFVSATSGSFVSVFDTRTLEQLEHIQIPSGKAGQDFRPASLELDADAGRLYAVGLGAAEVAVIDTASDKVEKVFPLDNARSAIGVGWDAENKRVLVVSQGSDNLLVVDPRTGKTVHDVYVGAGALNVDWDPASKLAYVSNRVAGTVAVVDTASGKLVANLDGGSNPNHVYADGKGNVFAINKSRGTDDPKGDRITRIAAKAQ